MRKYIILLALFLPLLAFGKVLKVKQYDWYLVHQSFKGVGWIDEFKTKRWDKIYIYKIKDGVVRIYLFDDNGKVKGWYWVYEGEEKIEDERYCTFIENRKDDRYK